VLNSDLSSLKSIHPSLQHFIVPRKTPPGIMEVTKSDSHQWNAHTRALRLRDAPVQTRLTDEYICVSD
jgi:hypothetical protein